MQKEFLDRLPFPLDVAVFGTGLVVVAVLFTGAVSGAIMALKVYALSDELKRVLDGIAEFFVWLLELPGTGEEAKT